MPKQHEELTVRMTELERTWEARDRGEGGEGS